MSEPSNPANALRIGVYQLIEQTLMAKETFDSLMGHFTIQLHRLGQTNLNDKDENFRRVHAEYIRVIEKSKANLTELYAVGEAILLAVNEVFTGDKAFETIQVELQGPLEAIQVQLQPLLQRHAALTESCTTLEAQYLSLLPVDTEGVPAEKKA